MAQEFRKPFDSNGKLIEKVKDVKGNVIYLDRILGQGGQGTVCRSLDKNLAVKFLTKDNKVICNERLYETFKEKVDEVSIMRLDEDIHLCKPEVMLEKPYCGYVMMLLNGLEPINNLIYNPNSDNISMNQFYIETGSLKKRLEVLIELARTIARLHSKGIVYCDISPNNVFFAKGNNFSNVWLIDCDNLKFSNELKKGIYTPGYGAPEIVNQISDNTIFSDCYSFAVLAFRVLTAKNPFEISYNESSSSGGWDASTKSKKDAYLESIGDWIVESDPAIKDKYLKHLMSKDLFELFDATFNSKGRMNPNTRPSMLKWYEELKRSYVRITSCSCGQYVLSFESECPFCKKELNKKSLISVYDANMSFIEAVENVKDYVNSINYDDEKYFINEEEVKRLKSKVHFEKAYDAILYNGFTIYNFNYETITVDEIPNPILSFAETNDFLFITNKSTIKFYYKTNKSLKFQVLPENFKIPKGEKILIVQIENNSNSVIKYLSVTYE